jgi:Resolvase, N terminal domain
MRRRPERPYAKRIVQNRPFLQHPPLPPPRGAQHASRTRVRNQRRITTPVTGFCDAPRMGHLLGYARVSTTDQQPQLQVDALERAGCYRVFTETASGARADRPPSSSSWTSSGPVTP